MADDQSDILKQFQEFLDAKAASDKEAADAEDFEVEIWDKDGRGVRTRRSHAQPFLQSLGLDIPAEPDNKDDGKGDAGKPVKAKPTAKGPTNSNVARRYFTKQTPAK